MMLVAIPMLLLYEISIIVAGMTRATRKSELIES
jgi:Sec-independent protein secretion pathway component TatC